MGMKCRGDGWDGVDNGMYTVGMGIGLSARPRAAL
jgi:hypothetical protein